MKLNVVKKQKPDSNSLTSLSVKEKEKLEELIFEEEKNGEKRVNKITLFISVILLIIIIVINIIFGHQANFDTDMIVMGLFFAYNMTIFILLRKNVYYPFFKYMTVFVNVTAVFFLLYLYSTTTGWIHATRTVTIMTLFIIICMAGFYQRPRVPIFAAILSSVGYLILFFYVVLSTDIPIVPIEDYNQPVISWDLIIIYPTFFLIVGAIVSTITRRLQITLGRSIHYEAEAFFKKEIEETNKKLKELDHFKTMFFQNITHEFRTPLTLIIGPLDSILNSESSSLSEPLRHQLMVIEENAKRLLHLVNQLLDLSKIEGKKMKLRACETDFVEFCKRIVAVYHSYAERKKIELTLATQTESLLLHIDQEKIEKVMHNLLSNAFKFVKPGGDITISVSGPIDVSLIEKNKGFIKSGILKVVQIKVKNTGIGIPSDALSSIFERFRQVDDSSTRNTEGTGIGLSLVKEYVELHYGAIDVCSELGKYTEFSVFLPFGKSHFKENEIISGTADASISDYVTLLPADKDTGKQEESYSDTGVQAVHGHEKLLIVEDNDDMIQYIKDVLKNNYAIYEAKNGEEGLARALHILPDLIISDVMMPKMDGNQLLEALRKNEKTKKIPVIILTAQASEDYKIQKLEEGVDDYISKPFNPRELQARVAILLKAREYERIIVDSITYAKRIQLSILPRDSILDQYMKEYFIIWKPRDIVGGDIYWFRNISDTEFILAVIDCTGHGVPGAVMTMIANSLLNRIVDDYVHDNPSQVLKNLNALMRDTLKQNIASALSDDGLDIGLCYVDTRNKTLLFSGARLSLFYFHDSTLREITGDKQSIGYKKSRDDYEYRNHEVHMKGSNMFYMATDGYYEQNSPESNLPLGREKFKELLKSCSSIPFVEQKSYLEKTLSQYQLDTPQRDDITLLGFHISL